MLILCPGWDLRPYAPPRHPAEVADAVTGAGYALAYWNFAAIGR